MLITTYCRSLLKNYLKEKGLTGPALEELSVLFNLKEYSKGGLFAQAGSVSGKVGFVISGLFYMYVIRENGTVFTKNFISEKGFLLAVFEPDAGSTVFIEALKNSVVLEGDYSRVLNCYDGYPEAAALARKGMEKQLASLYLHTQALATDDASRRYCMFREEYGSLEDEIPQYIIASYLGITPTQLSRIRKKIH